MSIQTEETVTYPLVIGGAEVGAGSGRTYESIDPYTGKPWAVVIRVALPSLRRTSPVYVPSQSVPGVSEKSARMVSLASRGSVTALKAPLA